MIQSLLVYASQFVIRYSRQVKMGSKFRWSRLTPIVTTNLWRSLSDFEQLLTFSHLYHRRPLRCPLWSGYNVFRDWSHRCILTNTLGERFKCVNNYQFTICRKPMQFLLFGLSISLAIFSNPLNIVHQTEGVKSYPAGNVIHGPT